MTKCLYLTRRDENRPVTRFPPSNALSGLINCMVASQVDASPVSSLQAGDLHQVDVTSNDHDLETDFLQAASSCSTTPLTVYQSVFKKTLTFVRSAFFLALQPVAISLNRETVLVIVRCQMSTTSPLYLCSPLHFILTGLKD